MQALFARGMNSEEDMVSGQKNLDNVIQNFYSLYLYIFLVFPEIRRYRLNKLEELKDKVNPTHEDLHPNTKFVDNLIIAQIEDNETLQKLWRNYKIKWPDSQMDVIVQLYHQIAAMPEFVAYMQNSERSYKEDRELVLFIIEEVLVNSTLLHWFFEEKNVHWSDDYDEAMLHVYKNILSFKESHENNCKIFPLFKNIEDEKSFYRDLYWKTIAHDEEYFEMINAKLQNWESERVMVIDMILMKMALCELMEFPTIPVKVIINEYIELAKLYSSAKSGIFINGILDSIVTDIKEQGNLNKIGRGLIDN